MAANGYRRTNYDVTWGSTLDDVDQVKPDLKLVTEPVRSGTYGGITLGKRVIALEGQVLVQVRQVTAARINALIPGAAAGPLVPSALNFDLYDVAQLLRLHPRDRGASTDEDLNLVKAVPVNSYNLTRDGTKDDVWEIAFEFFPDREKLAADPPLLVYGYVGPVPA